MRWGYLVQLGLTLSLYGCSVGVWVQVGKVGCQVWLGVLTLSLNKVPSMFVCEFVRGGIWCSWGLEGRLWPSMRWDISLLFDCKFVSCSIRLGRVILTGWEFKLSEVSICMNMWGECSKGGHSSCAWVPSWAAAESTPPKFDCGVVIWLVSPRCVASSLLIGIREEDDKYTHHQHHSTYEFFCFCISLFPQTKMFAEI